MKNKFDAVFISNDPNEKRSDAMFWEEYLEDETEVEEKKGVDIWDIIFKGGTGSGNFGHAGRPGQIGGSGGAGGQAGSLQEGKRKPKKDMMIEDVKLFDKKKYRTLSATDKVNMTAKYLNKYKSSYVLKKDWDKATEKLSSKDKKIWLSYNKGIGALEGVRAAKIKDGNKQQGKTRRKYYNMAVSYQDSARIMAFNRDTFHAVS